MKIINKVCLTLGCIIFLWLLWFFSVSDFGVDKHESQTIKELIFVKILPWIYNNLWVKIIISVLLILAIVGTWIKEKNVEKEAEKEL
jgi:hypothetical protein